MTPLGVANDRVRQIGGRYRDDTDFDFMMRMGVWTENLSLPAVINECIMQSFGGVIRVFPNTTNLGEAAFRDLRAAGAFLVSASWDGKRVTNLTLKSEKGVVARVANPWGKAGATARVSTSGTVLPHTERDGLLEFETKPGELYLIAAVVD